MAKRKLDSCSLLLSGFALICVSVSFLRGFVLPLSGLGLLTGITAIALALWSARPRLIKDGKAVKLAVQLGIDDGTWVEVTRKRSGENWLPCDGSEQILGGELSQLSDGEPVRATVPGVEKR